MSRCKSVAPGISNKLLVDEATKCRRDNLSGPFSIFEAVSISPKESLDGEMSSFGLEQRPEAAGLHRGVSHEEQERGPASISSLLQK